MLTCRIMQQRLLMQTTMMILYLSVYKNKLYKYIGQVYPSFKYFNRFPFVENVF